MTNKLFKIYFTRQNLLSLIGKYILHVSFHNKNVENQEYSNKSCVKRYILEQRSQHNCPDAKYSGKKSVHFSHSK